MLRLRCALERLSETRPGPSSRQLKVQTTRQKRVLLPRLQRLLRQEDPVTLKKSQVLRWAYLHPPVRTAFTRLRLVSL